MTLSYSWIKQCIFYRNSSLKLASLYYKRLILYFSSITVLCFIVQIASYHIVSYYYHILERTISAPGQVPLVQQKFVESIYANALFVNISIQTTFLHYLSVLHSQSFVHIVIHLQFPFSHFSASDFIYLPLFGFSFSLYVLQLKRRQRDYVIVLYFNYYRSCINFPSFYRLLLTLSFIPDQIHLIFIPFCFISFLNLFLNYFSCFCISRCSYS